MTNQSMKAAIIKHYSEDYDVFKYENVVKPEPGVGELLIKVQANGVNHCDTDLRKGLFGVDSKMPLAITRFDVKRCGRGCRSVR